MGRKSKAKGADGERDARNALRKLGISARRGRQYCGGPTSPDLVSDGDEGLPPLTGVHFEVKRTEALSLYAAMDQAEGDAGASVPVILHRRNRRPWVAVVHLDRILELAERLLEATRGSEDRPTG